MHLQRFMNSHYHVLTVLVHGKMGQEHRCALGIMLKNSVMSMENLIFAIGGVLHTEHRLDWC